MKRMIINVLDRLGYEIHKKKMPDSSVYDGIFPKQSLSRRRLYNIGAGLFQHQYWTNIDYATEHYGKVQKDFINYNLMEMKPLPIEDSVAEIVYSSHTIEHINDEAAVNMLRESYRILKPGGYIRLTTPDAWLEYQAYKRNDVSFWYWVDRYSKPGTWERLYKVPLSEASIHQLFLHHFASQLCEIDVDDSPEKKYSDFEISEYFSNNPGVSALDYFTRQCKFNADHPGNHINWWTHEKLISFLKEAGFSTPYVSGWGKSVLPPLRDTILFDNTHPNISLYVEDMI